MDITPLQAFAAGAALCSTSLGTTFTILGTSGLGQSRLGVVLSSAAMMDDIVGLVMSAVIGSLGTSSDFSAIAVIRPVFVSIAFAVVLPAICIWIVKPLAKLIYKSPITLKGFTLHRMLDAKGTAFAVHTLVLVGLVTGASYAGTSNLFAAYLAGACVTWWDGLCEQLSTGSIAKKSLQDGKKVSASKENVASSRSDRQREPHQQNQNLKSESPPSKEIPAQSHGNDQGGMSGLSRSDEHSRDSHGVQIFASYFSGPVERILKPFFFASIGFSIPIRRMFSGYVLWRGIVYFVLMTIGKLVCGMCLVRFKSVDMPSSAIKRLVPPRLSACWPWPKSSKVNESQHVNKKSSQPKTSNTAPAKSASNGQKRMQILKPKSLYPAALLGSAMVARGEIGFLISSVAETNGVFGSSAGDQNSDLFLVTTWAILLCTLCGPICVGMMVKSVRKLQAGERNQQSGREDPLGELLLVFDRFKSPEGSQAYLSTTS